MPQDVLADLLGAEQAHDDGNGGRAGVLGGSSGPFCRFVNSPDHRFAHLVRAPGNQRRREVHQDRVDLAGNKEQLEDILEHRRVGFGPEVDGVADAAVARAQSGDLGLEVGRELRHDQAVALTCIDSEDAWPTDVAQDRRAKAASQRLGLDDLGYVEELLNGVDPDYAGLAEQGGHRLVGTGQRGRM